MEDRQWEGRGTGSGGRGGVSRRERGWGEGE